MRPFIFTIGPIWSRLKTSGAEMVQFSPLKDSELPQNLDGLLIGEDFLKFMRKQCPKIIPCDNP